MEEENKKIIDSDLPEGENIKKSLIKFAKLNKYFIIPFIIPIIIFLTMVFFNSLREINIYKKRIEFIEIIYKDLTYLSAGLFYYISYCNSKNNKKEQNNNQEKATKALTFIYSGQESVINNPIKIVLLIILISIFLELWQLFSYFGNYENYSYISIIYYILSFPLISKLIIKEKIYKHQYLSIIISICGWVILIIPECLVFSKDKILPSFFDFISIINNALFIILIKYLNQKYYISPLKLSLLSGIISIIIHFIGFVFYSLIKYHDLSYFKDCFESSDTNKITISIYFILGFLFSTIQNILTLLSIFYFSPNLIIITNIISTIFLWIYTAINLGPKMPEFILHPIGSIICFFSLLIYNEIIILNFCGLSKNTKKFVEQRIIKELEEIQKEEDLLSDGDDEMSET